MDNSLLVKWDKATSNLSWGVARVFRDALQMVADEKVSLVYQADYRDGSPCLVNSVAAMLKSGGGHGVPSANYGEVVSLFDRINADLHRDGVNEFGKVSPLAAEVLLRAFAPERPKPIEKEVQEATQAEAFANDIYTETADEDMARDWLNSLQAKAPVPEEVKEQEVQEVMELLKPNGNI